MTHPQPKKSDLPTRVASAVVMVAVAGTALWLGGAAWLALCLVVVVAVLWEFHRLVLGFSVGVFASIAWHLVGIAYVGTAAWFLVRAGLTDLAWDIGYFPGPQMPFFGNDRGAVFLPIILAVVATDVGAYFVGRAVGGPKIASQISPSKTWSGLIGGVIGATLALIAFYYWQALLWNQVCVHCPPKFAPIMELALIYGPFAAVTAQAGDFFESWMKRRAGVKDSSRLIPGHGGVFDRVDGLIAVVFVVAIFYRPL